MVKKILIIVGCLAAAVAGTYVQEKGLHMATSGATDIITEMKNRKAESNPAKVEKTEEV